MRDLPPTIISSSEQRQNSLRQLLRDSEVPVTAANLSNELGVSVSTIERDIAELRSSGLNIESIRGRSGGLVLTPHNRENATATPTAGTRSSSPFIGRAHELDRLMELQAESESGSTNVVALSGEPGVGKSRLLKEFELRCGSLGIKIFRADCYDRLGTPPFHPWNQILQSATNTSGRQWYGESPVDSASWQEDSHTGRFRLFDRIGAQLRDACESGTVIILDDLHYGDASTIDMLEYLSTQTPDTGLLIVFAYNNRDVSRRTPLQRLLGRLVSRQNFLRIRIESFTTSEVDDLIQSHAEVPLNSEARSIIHSRAEGNALFATELIDLFSARRSSSDPHRIYEDLQQRVPEGIRDSISGRLDRCSEACAELLTVAALLGTRFSLAQLEAVASPGSSAGELLEEADRHGLVQPESKRGDYRFTHGLIRDTLTDEISPTRFLRLSGRIATALETHYGENSESHAVELAKHFVTAESITGIRKAAHYSILAGEQSLAVYSFAEAEAHFTAADSLARGTSEDELRWKARLGLGRATAANLARADKHQAVTLLAEVVDHYIDAEDIESAAYAALTDVVAISPGQSGSTNICAMIERVLERVTEHSTQTGHLLTRYAQALAVERNDLAGAEKAARSAREIGVEQHDESLVLKAERALLAVTFYSGGEQLDFELARSLIRRAARARDFETELRCRFYLVSALMLESPLATSRREAQVFLERAERFGEIGSLQQALGLATHVLIQEGSFDEALALARRNLELDSRSEWATASLYTLSGYTGQPFSQEQVRASLSSDSNLPLLTRVRNATAALLGTDDHQDAAFLGAAQGVASELAASVANSHRSHPSRLAAGRLEGLLAVATDDTKRSQRLYTDILRTPKAILHIDGVHRDRILARLAIFNGSTELGLRHLRSAIGHAENTGARCQLVHLLCDLVALQIKLGASADAGQTASKALKLATELGIDTASERIAAIEASGSVRLNRRSANGLTRRESEVLPLIAGGMRNREIAAELVLSERTVQRHIANIYEKIGARNRSEATAYALKHSGVPDRS